MKLLVSVIALTMMAWVGAATADARPSGTAVGIGAGWNLPTDIDTLNTASVRVRLAGGITFEPRVELGFASQKSDFGPAETETSTTTALLATTARFPLASMSKLDLVALGGATFSYAKTNPDGAGNDRTDAVVSLQWGLGIDYWISERWGASASATNPLASRTSSSQEMGGADQTTTTTAFGLIFAPDIIVMVHLYY